MKLRQAVKIEKQLWTLWRQVHGFFEVDPKFHRRPFASKRAAARADKRLRAGEHLNALHTIISDLRETNA